MKHFSSLFRPATGLNTAKLSVRWAVVLLLLVVPLLSWAQYPSISNFSPTSGSTGTSLVITGSGFTSTGTIAVRFPDAWGRIVDASNFVVNSANQLTVQVPVGALSGPITVLNAGNFAATSVTSFVTDNYLIGTGDLTVCSGKIYDDGGAASSPTWQREFSTTISPATAGSKVRLAFTQFDTDPVDARLYIYDGPDFNAPLIGQYAGLNGPGAVAATNPTGQLTIRYASSFGLYSTNRPGFAATISCVAGVPTISSFTPTNGAAGTSVVITGVNFSGTTAVRFNGTASSGVVVNSSTQITVPVPAGATSGPITVTNAIGTGRSGGSFILQPLTISSFTPTSGTGGTSVVITGLHFTGASAVRFNGTPAPSFTVDSDTQLTVQVPTGNTSGPISVTTPSGTGASTVSFTVLPLFISSFTPTTGAAGTSVVITGTNFSGTTAVRFNGLAASGYSVNADGTQLTVSVPAGATTGPISVTNALGTGTSATSFTLAPPVISSFTPANGLVGASVVITGTSFLQASAVRFNGLAASGFVVNSSTQITVSVPAGATSGPISVTTHSGTGTSASSFTVLAPVISSFTPTTGAAGTSVVITGTNFSGTTAVRFNGLAASGYSVNADGTQIAVNVPAGATSGPISVTTPTGTGTSTTNFTVPEPTISSFSPTSGISGTSVVITGTNFTGTTAVRFNGTAATGFVVNSDTQLTVNVPAGASTGPLTVTTGATATSATSFVTDNYWLSPAAITACSGTLYDANGPNNVTAQDNTTTLSPATSGAMVRLTFTQFRLDTSTGTLYIYDGPGTNAPLLGQYNAVANPGVVTATNATGQLTLRLVSGNPAAAQPGFAATISCVVGVPIISSFTPTSGGQSASVTITGTNFTGTTAVRFNGALASGFVVDSDTQITVPVPAGATSGPIAVTNGISKGTSATSFTVLAPAISSFTPTSGGQSVSVTITGANFTGTTAVRFNGALAPGFVVNSDTQITAIVSTGAISGPLAVTNGVGTGTSATSFTVLAPTISSFTPSSGTGGTSVVITGANFTGITAVAFNGTAAASFVVDSDTQITASVSAGTISGFITVTNGVGTGTSASNFVTGESQAPLLTSVSPARNLPMASLGADVVLTFSQPIAASTAGNVRVFGSQRGGQLVRGGNVTASGNTITVDPARPFAPGERVMVTVPAAVQSTDGYSTVARVHEFTAETALAPATFLDPATSYAMQAQSRNVAVGDLNGDGVLDVVTGDYYGGSNESGSAVVRFGLGNGLLGSFVEYNTPYPDAAITLSDVDSDGDLDLVTTAPTTSMGNEMNQVYTRLNNGSGSFGTPVSTQVAPRPNHTVLGDLDGDGDLDMLTAASQASLNFNTNGVFSNTSIRISTRTTTGSATTAVDVSLGDVDGDGDLDALIANGSIVSVRLNGGSGTFSGTYDVPMGRAMTNLVVGDVDGDGDLDLATSSSSTSTVSVRLNNGNGTFGGGADYTLAFAPETLALGDLDGDGDLDLVTAGNQPGMSGAAVGQAVVRLNNGSGTFSGGSNVGTGGSQPFVALGDMDGDGTLDLLTSHEGNSRGAFGVSIGNMAYDFAQLFIRFNTALPATLAGFSPLSGPAGTLVTITGTNLTAVRSVRFGSSSELAFITSQSPTSLTVQVPVGAASGAITLTTSKGVVLTTATAFTYTPHLNLTATLSPAGPLEVCAPRTLTATASSPAFTTGKGLFNTTDTNTNVNGIIVRPNGKLLVVGAFVSYGVDQANGIVQLNPDGTRDADFLTGTGFTGSVNAVALQADGKALVGGDFTMYNSTAATRLIRLNANGSLDATFATGTSFDAAVQTIVVQPDGQVLVSGSFTTYNGPFKRNRIIRLNPNGSRDASFDTGSGDTGGFNSTVQTMVVQPDGKVLVGGAFITYNGISTRFLARLHPNGSYDDSFISGAANVVNTLALQADGKVLVGGTFSSYSSTQDLRGIVRLEANGTRDIGFVTGTGFTSSTGSTAPVTAVVLQSDGKILVSGQFVNYNGLPQNRLARLATDGTLDATFNIGTGFDVGVRRLAVQPDGSVVVGGLYTQYQGAPAGHLIRLLPDGSANTAPTPVSGASFTFAPGNTTTNPLVTSTAGAYSVVASLNGATSPASNAVTLADCGALTAVTSIVRASANPTNASTVSYTVTFAAGVTGVTASNFSLTAPSLTNASITGVSGGGTTYAVAVNTGTGDGTLTLQLANATGILPGVSNTLPLAGETYTIDKTAPTVTSLTGPGSSGSTTSTMPFAFTVIFSETVTNFSTSGITVTNGAVTSDPSGSGTTYDFTVTPTTPTTPGTATTVTIATGAAIDAVGNPSAAFAPYSLTYLPPIVTVAPTITLANPSKTYGDAAYQLAATSSSPGSFTYSVVSGTGATVTSAGLVTITGAGSIVVNAAQAASGNFLAGEQTATLTIEQRPLTVTAAAQTKVFGAADPAPLTYTVTSGVLAGTDAFSGSLSRTAGEDVGEYAITQGTLAAGANYALRFVGANLRIAQASNTISFSKPADQTYALNQTLDLTASATSALPVSFAVVSGPARISGSVLTITGAGLVVVEATQGGSSNYAAATPVSHTFSVAKASQTITFAALVDKTFTDADFAVSASSSAGLPVSFAVSGNGSLVGGQVHLTGAGSVTVTASQTGDGNYLAAAPVARTFAVAKATATLALGNLSQSYTGAALAAMVTPTPAGLSGVNLSYAQGTTAVAAPTEAGSYTVSATLSNDNYVATPASGTLVIGKAAATVTLANLSQTYSGSATAATATTTATGSSSSFTFAYTLAGAPVVEPTNAGSYGVTATLVNTNFGGSASGELVIGPATPRVTVAVATSYTYTGQPQGATTAAVTGVGGVPLNKTVTYAVTTDGGANFANLSAKPTNAGSYKVTVAFDGSNANYGPASDSRTFAIGKATATIVVSGYSGTYDGQAHGATGTARGVSNTDLSSLLSLGNSFTNVPGGTANWSFAGNGNYNPATGAVPITINPQTGVPVADTYYVGSNFYWTTNSTSSNTTLNLVATLKNDPNYNTGVITSARVSFRIRNTDGTFTLINGAQNLPVGLVNAGDNTVGTASTSVPYSITGTNTTSLRIEVVLSGNYRSVATTLTSALITIAAPTPGGLIAGGGKFQVASSTSPQPAGYVKGTGAQFSYFVKYSKSGLNPQGSVEVLVTSLNDYTTGLPDGKQHYYLLKSNSISTLAITNPSAQFTGKANISEVNFDGTQILKSIEGNCTMQLDMVDQFRNPTQQLCTVDQLAITVYRSKGGVWYSSAWNGSKPVLSPVSPKDDITVTGNAGTCGATLLKATTTSTSSSSPSVVVEGTSATQQVGSNLLEVYPAPLSTSGTVHFHTAKSGKAQVYLYDQLGKLVATLHNAEVQAGREYYLPLLVGQLESGVYFCRLIANGKVENRRVMVVK